MGGAVRDQLLGLPVKERDWVVVGSTTEAMLAAGFRQVGKAFPVFHHPQTGEEYALARTERKTGAGHQAFETDSGPQINLEQDLKRRDLTINAIAMREDGLLIDPMGGQEDLSNRILRHVSDAFVEDPLRCFRVARFASCLKNFKVHQETLDLMQKMSEELATLSAERIWNEWVKALSGFTPHRFYEVLSQAGISDPWFEGVDLQVLIGEHKKKQLSISGGFALIGWTQETHVGDSLMNRLKSPKKVVQLVKSVNLHGEQLASFNTLTPVQVLDLLQALNAFNDHARLERVISTMAEFIDINAELIWEMQAALKEVKSTKPPSVEAGEDIHIRRLAIAKEQLAASTEPT